MLQMEKGRWEKWGKALGFVKAAGKGEMSERERVGKEPEFGCLLKAKWLLVVINKVMCQLEQGYWLTVKDKEWEGRDF